MKVLITTVPFANKDDSPIKALKKAGIEYVINPLNRKLTEIELAEMITDFDAIIAGTEPITELVMSKGKKLKFISRVGIGLDSVDLNSARKFGIKVSYTPDAPAPAVAELTLGMMLSLIRFSHVSNLKMHKGEWHRYFGRRLSEITIGIIGVGRIGSRVLQHLKGFSPSRVLINDLKPNYDMDKDSSIEWCNKEEVLSQADIISLHLPLTGQTKNFITKSEMAIMKSDAIIINTSRGGIINENDLYDVMKSGHLSAAAIDVFEQEPYDGKLREIDHCLLTAHMGSMSVDCRTLMEVEATNEAIRFFKGESLEGEVPEEEYEVQYIKV
jgi:D-3-phosphoglycerate dehydrogenase / 2-oxoglutarate reductase